MSLQRVGVLSFGVGLLLASLSAVVFGFGCTEAACPDAVTTFVPTAVNLGTGAVSFFDGCNTCTTGPGVAHGLVLLVAGVAVGGVGVVRELSDPG